MVSAIPSRSILTILEPGQKIKYMGLLDAIITIGDGLGPIIGSVLYQLVGFVYMFLIIGILILIYFPLMVLTMSHNIDSDQETESIVISRENISSDSKISIFRLFSNKMIFL